jgi:hypothetical protein
MLPHVVDTAWFGQECLQDKSIRRMAATTVVWLDIQVAAVQVHGSGAQVVWDNVLPMLCQCLVWGMEPQQAAAEELELYKEQKSAVRGAPALATKMVITAMPVVINGAT